MEKRGEEEERLRCRGVRRGLEPADHLQDDEDAQQNGDRDSDDDRRVGPSANAGNIGDLGHGSRSGVGHDAGRIHDPARNFVGLVGGTPCDDLIQHRTVEGDGDGCALLALELRQDLPPALTPPLRARTDEGADLARGEFRERFGRVLEKIEGGRMGSRRRHRGDGRSERRVLGRGDHGRLNGSDAGGIRGSICGGGRRIPHQSC